MFHVKNHKQAHIFDPWGHLSPRRRKLLDKSWSGLFQQEILPTLPVDTLMAHYHDWNGRPTKELYSMIGMMTLQQMHDLTDEQAIGQFCFNIQWHYALNITSVDSYLLLPEKVPKILTNGYIFEKMQTSKLEKKTRLKSENLQPLIRGPGLWRRLLLSLLGMKIHKMYHDVCTIKISCLLFLNPEL